MDTQTTVPRIFKIMSERKLTAKQVSDGTGISASSFTDWKKGRCCPGQSALTALSDYFNVSVDYLLGTDSDVDSLDKTIQAEVQQLSDEQKAEALNYIKYIKQKN